MEQEILELKERISILENDIRKMNLVLGSYKTQLDDHELYNSI